MNKKIRLTLLLFLALISITAAAEENLPVKLEKGDDFIVVTNIGKCPIYKLEIATLPPSTSLLVDLVKLVTAASFKKDIGTLEPNYYIRISNSEIINGDGKRLDSSYVIGKWILHGNHCGDDLGIFIKDH